MRFFFSSGLGWVGWRWWWFWVVVLGWVGLGWAAVVVGWFLFCRYGSFCRTVFVGRWVAMVLTSSSCNLGIDNFDSRQVPIYSHIISPSFNSKFGLFEISRMPKNTTSTW